MQTTNLSNNHLIKLLLSCVGVLGFWGLRFDLRLW